jgi:hypothetical protein
MVTLNGPLVSSGDTPHGAAAEPSIDNDGQEDPRFRIPPSG